MMNVLKMWPQFNIPLTGDISFINWHGLADIDIDIYIDIHMPFFGSRPPLHDVL